MTMPRSALISLSETPWYHIVSRCVRRAYLCGEDHVTGQNFNHRRGWIEARIRELAGVFAIDVAAYAVMSNHYHIVLRVDEERARHWDDTQVLSRWTQLFRGSEPVQRYLSADVPYISDSDLNKVSEWVEIYRQRLYDISWFMRVLNETLARMANAEDGIGGRFWEGRFKSQALLDEQSILAAMTYVDLNPIRAAMATTPEGSEHTSIKLRLEELISTRQPEQLPAQPAVQADESGSPENPDPPDTAQGGSLRSEADLQKLPEAPLMPFDAGQRHAAAIPFGFADYVDLVEMMGRVVHPHKRGKIPDKTPAILQRLDIDVASFVAFADSFLQEFGSVIGTPQSLSQVASHRQCRCPRGMTVAKALFPDKVA
jgi:REP element-mobilizing transposase RayT